MFILPSVEIQSALEQALESVDEITRRLHQLYDTDALLNYGVQAIQELFACDRVLVYQFLPANDGVVIAESVADGWLPIIGQLIYDPCFQNHWAEPYRQGRVSQIPDIEESTLAPCHVELLTQIQVKANLVVPIVLKPSPDTQSDPDVCLWDLLIMQQCSAPRTWQPLEVQVLRQLALQLSIAIEHIQTRSQWQTERQQRTAVETQLHQSEAYWCQLIEQSPLAIMAFAPDGTFRSANPSWETLWQASRDGLSGFNLRHDPQFIAAGCLQFWQRAQAGEAINLPPLYYNPALSGYEGRPQWSEGQLYPLKDETGKVREIRLIQHDVTDRVIAQQERDRFFTHAHDLMAISDQNSTITLANPAWQVVLGYAVESLVGMRFLDLVHPKDSAAVLAVFEQHTATTQPMLNLECRFHHRDGSYRWITWNTIYSDGLSYVFGRDITQQKQLAAALKQQEERWQLAIQGSNDGIWDWNIVTGELFLSARWKEILGYTDDEIEPTLEAWDACVHPDDLSRVKQTIQDHLNRQTPFLEIEQRMRCRDGTYKWFLVRAQVVWNEADRAIRMVGFYTDISDRKQAELSLQEREETLRLLIKYAPANIAMFDQDMNYLMITQRGVDACQLGSIEAVLGRPHYDIFPRAAQWQHVHQRCLGGAVEKCDESLLTQEDGTQYWTRWEIHPWYKPNQTIGGIILFSEDITAQKQAAQELQRSVEELTRLNQLKDDFLSTVSHELRTPMSNIRMATQMLEIGLKAAGALAEASNATNRYLQILKAECQREIQLINDLLNLTHLEAGTEPLDFTAVDLSRLMPRLAEPFVERTQQHQQRLKIAIPDQLAPITTDLSYVEHTVTELLQNACKYTPTGETICLSVQPTPESLMILVSNSGVMISPSEADRIFDKFYRIPNHDPWKYGGVGLGLALVKKMVDRLGGTITVCSQQPNTTLFTLCLPYHARPPQ